jgi:hypothetical protein
MGDESTDRVVDKSTWGEGPWQSEPDRFEWRAEGSRYPALIVRGEATGALCGYVGVPPGHPLHGREYAAIDVDVHGGLTFGGACSGHICHVAKPGEPDDVWWFGFDCGHGFDLMPALEARLARHRAPGHQARQAELNALTPDGLLGAYKPLAYVRAEVESLAQQLAAMAADHD